MAGEDLRILTRLRIAMAQSVAIQTALQTKANKTPASASPAPRRRRRSTVSSVKTESGLTFVKSTPTRVVF